MDHDSGLAYCRDRVFGRTVAAVELGVGTFLTFSFEGTDARLWVYMSAWNLSSADGMVVACEDDRDSIPDRLDVLVGRSVTQFDADRSNNLTLCLEGDLVLKAVATDSEEDPWLLFETGAWFLAAGTDGGFTLEDG